MEGELSPEFTYDGLHLNGRGLKQLAARLQQLKITTATIRRSKKAA